MNQSTRKGLALQIAILAASEPFFYIWAGPPMAIIFALLWLDKAILPLLKFANYFGLELTTLPIILVGIIYGPLFGFVFSFLIVAALGGVLNVIAWKIVPPVDVNWPPILPSPDNSFAHKVLKDSLSYIFW